MSSDERDIARALRSISTDLSGIFVILLIIAGALWTIAWKL